VHHADADAVRPELVGKVRGQRGDPDVAQCAGDRPVRRTFIPELFTIRP
jgi:hypothetical protein